MKGCEQFQTSLLSPDNRFENSQTVGRFYLPATIHGIGVRVRSGMMGNILEALGEAIGGYVERLHLAYGTMSFRHGHLAEVEQAHLAAPAIAQSSRGKYKEVSTLCTLLDIALAHGHLDRAKYYVMQAQAKRRISFI